MKIREITYVALFAAFMGILGLIPPITLSFTPVPITLQTLGVLLAGGILGPRLGSLSIVVFLLVVAAGMPLLPGGRGGIGVFFGPSGGYLIGYVIAAFFIGLIFSKLHMLKFRHILAANLTAGVFSVYLTGVPVQAFVMDLPLLDAIKLSLVYVPGDLAKAAIASILVYRLQKYPIFSHSAPAQLKEG
ncbi:biotin transporter BioY [Ureibacillus sp. FSL K6-8385]|uniref:Biotin transporter n=1 Tax=Ureibacillus terrenus TaxID=118246 RepID=A0A540V1N4_9BACL|nr:biotin transporter BioY [Ureibacillus terrenus]MED3662020.1 biotin transporter BioY [Ureibacillus terrenus]MED3764701.1 biotin transporter BioY [Ureibacillus terrenus]TQE90646.1 biotin transporter BioY [Ureibacillus terrenus]